MNKKVLWPWAKRYVMGTSEIHPQDSSEAEIKEDAKLPYDSSPIEINEWFHTFMYMNIPIAGWFYLKKLTRQPEHNKLQDFARAYLYYKMVFLAISLDPAFDHWHLQYQPIICLYGTIVKST